MKITIAPNAFKGCATASQTADSIAKGVMRACPTADVNICPVADGGDGLLDVAASALNADMRSESVVGPLGEQVEADYALTSDGTAIIEMALASGIALVSPTDLNPLRASTFGTGQLLIAAINANAKRVIVGLGGSATNDGGMGCAAALGYRFLAADGTELDAIPSNLDRLASIDASGVDPRLAELTIECASDVTNPLCGDDGASAVFGPQKGANAQMVQNLDARLEHLSQIAARDLSSSAAKAPGAGAAGGLGFGLMTFANAKIRSGIDLVLELVKLDTALENADLCITGEGRIDDQTQFGKAPAGVARLANAHGVPCIALAGSIGPDLGPLPNEGLTASFALADGPMSLEASMADTQQLLARAAEQAVRLFVAGRAG